MWPQLGCRQWYSDGDDGEVGLYMTLVNGKSQILAGKCGLGERSVVLNERPCILESHLILRSFLCLEEDTGAVSTSSMLGLRPSL